LPWLSFTIAFTVSAYKTRNHEHEREKQDVGKNQAPELLRCEGRPYNGRFFFGSKTKFISTQPHLARICPPVLHHGRDPGGKYPQSRAIKLAEAKSNELTEEQIPG
jgi:hypothetical protein